MRASAEPNELPCTRRARIALGAILLLTAAVGPADAAGCAFEPQGEGRVTTVIDARSFRLQDGREVRLAGIEPVAIEKPPANRAPALAEMLNDRDVRLHGEDDTPDRYGRQPAFVFLVPSETLVQAELLAQGEALVSATVTDRECAALLMAAEAAARKAKRGIWGDPAAIKNTESPGDILAGIGRFTRGRGQGSVRPTGGGNDLPEFRTELDTGFRCDYFKAGATCLRGCRHCSQVSRKSADSCPGLR